MNVSWKQFSRLIASIMKSTNLDKSVSMTHFGMDIPVHYVLRKKSKQDICSNLNIDTTIKWMPKLTREGLVKNDFPDESFSNSPCYQVNVLAQ